MKIYGLCICLILIISLGCGKEDIVSSITKPHALELRNEGQGVTVHKNDVGFGFTGCGLENLEFKIPDGYQHFVYYVSLLIPTPRITPSELSRLMIQVLSSSTGYNTVTGVKYLLRATTSRVSITKGDNDQKIIRLHNRVILIGHGSAPDYHASTVFVLHTDKDGNIIKMESSADLFCD